MRKRVLVSVSGFPNRRSAANDSASYLLWQSMATVCKQYACGIESLRDKNLKHNITDDTIAVFWQYS